MVTLTPETNDAQHLVDLGHVLNDNIETYLRALEDSDLPAPNFRPGAATVIPPDPLGADAHRAIINTAERILALTTGPAGLYHLSRQCLETTAVSIAVELNLPAILPLAQSLTAQQLAAAAGADESIVARVMRVLTPLFIFEEVAPQTYRHTARSASMRVRGVAALMAFGGAECMRAAAHLPETLKAAGYREVDDPGQTAFCRAYGTGLGFFNYVNKHAEMSKRFNDAMAGTMNLSYEAGSVVDIFPFDRLAQYGDKIVDIGGGKGHMMVSIAQRFPDADLRFVVQDFAVVVDAGCNDCPAELRHKFEWVAFDFLAGEQPVKHAAAYFMRHIMHNWGDSYCVQILKPIVAAMKPGVSRLLVADMVVPEMNAPKDLAHRDLLMMAHVAGKERTEGHFVRLLKEVHPAMELQKVWSPPTCAPGCGARVLEFVLRS